MAVALDGPPLGVVIQVADTGPGIPAEDLPHIFECFYRVDKSRSHRQGGAGLGLALVRAIVESHGGWVGVDSILGKGSTFTVYLPLTAAAAKG
jgi:two-component system sensor histidine kinase BaeS